MANKLLSIIKEFRERTRDPVKHCLIYRAVGCVHVDGMLCNMRTCTIKAVIEVTPMATKEIDPLPDNDLGNRRADSGASVLTDELEGNGRSDAG